MRRPKIVLSEISRDLVSLGFFGVAGSATTKNEFKNSRFKTGTVGDIRDMSHEAVRNPIASVLSIAVATAPNMLALKIKCSSRCHSKRNFVAVGATPCFKDKIELGFVIDPGYIFPVA